MVIISCNTNKKQEYVIEKKLAMSNKQKKSNLKDLVDSTFRYKYLNSESGRTLQNPKEVELDKKIVQLTKKYIVSNEKERSILRTLVSENNIYTIFNFCERATVFGLRKQNDNIKFGLTALSMVEAERCDYRDVLMTIAFVNHGVEKLRLDVDKLYDKAIKLANPRMKELLSSFKEREPKHKIIKAMTGYTEYQFDDGIGFIRCGHDEYNPKRDLPSIAFAIGKEIGKDKYHTAHEISIGESIWWIERQNDKEIKELLNQSLGTLSLRARLRKEITEDWMFQTFILYLVEFENKNKASKFRKLLGDGDKEKFARIFGSAENIFYLLISKSGKVGLQNYETNESLQRFRDSIEEEIKKENSH